MPCFDPIRKYDHFKFQYAIRISKREWVLITSAHPSEVAGKPVGSLFIILGYFKIYLWQDF